MRSKSKATGAAENAPSNPAPGTPLIQRGNPKIEIAYADKLADAINQLPKSFSELKASKKTDEAGAPAFTVSTDENQAKIVWFPDNLPEDRPAVERSLALILSFAALIDNDIKVVSTKNYDSSLWNLLEAMENNLLGASYAANKFIEGAYKPINNVPAEIKRGWDYLSWYAFAMGANTNEYNEGFVLPRTTNLLSADQGKWSEKAGKYADYDRIVTIVRNAAKKLGCCLGEVAQYIRPVGFFCNKYVGKRPVKGLYTTEEFTHLDKEWTTRLEEIKRKYENLPTTFDRLGQSKSLNKYLSELAVPLSETSKRIESAKSSRIPYLLVQSGRGRSAAKTIAKGGDLPEKLIAIEGGESVRTISKVMYSPLIRDWSYTAFAQAVQLEVRSRNLRDNESLLGYCRRKVQEGTANPDQAKADEYSSAIEAAAQVYLEVLPDKRGNVAWDSTFGVFKAH
jgi:hypothetical protein